jgi:2,3-bisphosphoglycerate-dependent phosphoglycerate mutase
VTTLVLVRHGESRATVDRVIGGPIGCKGLTDRGRRQAMQLRDRLERTGELVPDVVLASTLPRAIETAEVVCGAFPGRAVATHDDYCEQLVGECDGLTVAEYERQYGTIHTLEADRPFSPAGESPRVFDERVRRATAALAAQYRDQNVMLFTHGGFVYAATLYLLGAPGIHEWQEFWHPARSTSLTILVSAGSRWVLDRYNDAAHLTD